MTLAQERSDVRGSEVDLDPRERGACTNAPLKHRLRKKDVIIFALMSMIGEQHSERKKTVYQVRE
jgi:hypothetical protein